MSAMNIEQGFGRPASVIEAEEVAPAGRRRWPMVLAVAVLVVLAVLYAAFWRGAAPKAAPDARPTVSVIVPRRRSVAASVNGVGTLAARVDMPVGVAGEGGMVTRVLVQPGDWVGAGQVLATIDASVAAQQSAQMAATISAARADADVAQDQLDRANKLVARGFISRADIAQKTATRDAAAARVKLAQAQYGEMSARRARLDIRSPAAGLVLTRAVEPGQIVSAGGPALFRVAARGELELKAKLPEQDLARLRIGSPAEVTPVGAGRSFAGSVWQLSPVIDPLTRQGDARIALAYDPALRPGGFAQAAIRGGTADVPLLPESAVESDAKGNFVYVIGPGDIVVRRDVKVGDVSDTGISIVAGLDGGERVVLSAGAFLNPGDKVKPVLKAAG